MEHLPRRRPTEFFTHNFFMMSEKSHVVNAKRFRAFYEAELMKQDTPSCYIAYIRAEQTYEAEFGKRRYCRYESFLASYSRANARERRRKRLRILTVPELQC